MLLPVVVPQALPMVRGHQHDRPLHAPPLAVRLEQAPDVVVHEVQVGVVDARHAVGAVPARLEALQELAGRDEEGVVGIEVVHPLQHGSVLLLEPGDRLVRHRIGASLGGDPAALLPIASAPEHAQLRLELGVGVEGAVLGPVVEVIEAVVEAEALGRGVGADEGSRGVTGLPEDAREGRRGPVEVAAGSTVEDAHAVARRVQAREDRRMGHGRDARGRHRELEAHAVGCECVEVRGRVLSVAVAAQPVGTRGVQRDEEHAPGLGPLVRTARRQQREQTSQEGRAERRVARTGHGHGRGVHHTRVAPRGTSGSRRETSS